MRNNKTIVLTVIICLLPILLGIAFYNDLPEQMPIHFNASNLPDNYASKDFAIFGIPCILALLQIFCGVVTRLSVKKEKIEVEKLPIALVIVEWIVPVITVIVYPSMIFYGLNYNVPIGKIICFMVGMVYLLMGNYMPKMKYEIGRYIVNPRPKDEETYRRRVRFTGYALVILGIVFLVLTLFV